MLRVLTPSDTQIILEFCYKREKENLFVIGSFELYDDPFVSNTYVGYFELGSIVGLATYFSRYQSFAVNTDNFEYIPFLVDFFKEKVPNIKYSLGFAKYARPVYEYIQKTYEKSPKTVREETVHELSTQSFVNFHKKGITIATKQDTDDIVKLLRNNPSEGESELSLDERKKPVTEQEKKQVNMHKNFILRIDGNIVSKANIHGRSKNYFQIGGVVTEKAYRGKGCAKQVVSALCQYYFEAGRTTGLLFTGNENKIAQSVYKSIGFRPTDQFLIVEY